MRSPNSMEMDAMRKLFVAGPTYRTEFPVAIISECVKRGWVGEDNHGFVSLTADGQHTYEVRK